MANAGIADVNEVNPTQVASDKSRHSDFFEFIDKTSLIARRQSIPQPPLRVVVFIDAKTAFHLPISREITDRKNDSARV